jgi:hypothetical protein
MKQLRGVMLSIGMVLLFGLLGQAQQSGATVANGMVPPLIQFSNVATDEGENTLSGAVSITFSLYNNQQGGVPLWTETQNNVQLDSTGHYSVELGVTQPNGVPTALFANSEARWLGVRIAEQVEQPRVLLLSVPYALKAGDAATIGGLPPSAFVLAAPLSEAAPVSTAEAGTEQGVWSATATDVTTTGGSAGYLPVFSGAASIIDSLLSQSGTTLNVRGAATVEGLLTLPATGTATSSAGKVSQGQEFLASLYNSGTAAAVSETFDLRAEPVGNDTASPSATLSLLFASGTTAPGETGLKIASNGRFTFAAGQTFPGTVASVASGAGLTGGPITKTGTLSIASAGVTNTMLANPSLTVTAGGGMTGGGSVALGGATTLGLKTCAANQVLQYVSGVWTCANVGTGTVTSVASGTGLTGGPITGSGTLSLASNACAAGSALSALPFTCSPFASLGINTFANNQTINGEGGVGSYGLTVNQPTQTGILVEGPIAGAGAGLDLQTTGTGGNDWEILATGNSSSQGVGKLNIRDINTNTDVLTIEPTDAVNVDTSLTVTATAPSGEYAAGSFTGWSAPSGSNYGGGDGIDSTGGNGDPADVGFAGSLGGSGFYGAGGTGGGTDGVGGAFIGGDSSVFGDGIEAQQGSGSAGTFGGDVLVSGTLSATTKYFKIDYPLDPANKYLLHASVESSEMMNIYTGNVTTDGQGHATVQLPEWFEVLNTDFRYQLTVIGQFAQAIIARKVENNQFEIQTSASNVEVSWQVTGVRQDPYAKGHPLVVEQEKEARLRGFYIHPELYGAPPEKQIEWARHPQMMKKIQAAKARQLAAAQKLAAATGP